MKNRDLEKEFEEKYNLYAVMLYRISFLYLGNSADAEDVQGAVDAILTLYNDREQCCRLGDNARTLACTRFSKEAGTAANITLLK